MAETIPNTSTFDALTADYTPRVLVDNIFVGTPFLQKARQNMLAISGRDWTPIVQYGTLSPEWYTAGSQLTGVYTPSGQIAMRAKYTPVYARLPVTINSQDIIRQGDLALVDLMKSYVENAAKSLNTFLSTATWTTVSNAVTAIPVIIDNISTVGGLDGTSTYTWWRAHSIEGTSTYSVAVSPSIANFEKMIREIVYTCGPSERPDLIVVAPALLDKLIGQVQSNEYAMALAANLGNDIVKWGFSTLFIDGVPVVADRTCPGSAWVSGQSTRTNAAGYQAYFINFKHLKLAYNRRRFMTWEEKGWATPDDYDQYLNKIYAWCQYGTDMRRAHGCIRNIDITQELADFTPSTVVVPA